MENNLIFNYSIRGWLYSYSLTRLLSSHLWYSSVAAILFSHQLVSVQNTVQSFCAIMNPWLVSHAHVSTMPRQSHYSIMHRVETPHPDMATWVQSRTFSFVRCAALFHLPSHPFKSRLSVSIVHIRLIFYTILRSPHRNLLTPTYLLLRPQPSAPHPLPQSLLSQQYCMYIQPPVHFAHSLVHGGAKLF